jgi:hypothetical protein
MDPCDTCSGIDDAACLHVITVDIHVNMKAGGIAEFLLWIINKVLMNANISKQHRFCLFRQLTILVVPCPQTLQRTSGLTFVFVPVYLYMSDPNIKPKPSLALNTRRTYFSPFLLGVKITTHRCG